MSADIAPVRRELARTFLAALRPALAGGAGEAERAAAREAARLLGLAGLDRALATLHELGGGAAPEDARAIAGRLLRLAAEAEVAADVGPFERSDAELAALADEIESYDWYGADPAENPDHPAVATLPLDRVFDRSLVAGGELRSLAAQLRLAAPVAASLRAALDWLSPEDAAVRGVRLRGEPSLLEVRLTGIEPRGLGAAHRVIGAVGGNLGPALEDDRAAAGEWIVRVPSFALRPSYLMVIQGGLRLAIPWHSVLRLRMLSPAEMVANGWRQGHPVLDFLATPSPTAIEYPVVLVGHGLKRGHFIADRLVWRLAAEPVENEWGSPATGLRDTVRSEEGEIFWVAEPGRLLQHLPVPEPELRSPAPAPAPLPTLTDRDVEPLDAGGAEPAPGSTAGVEQRPEAHRPEAAIRPAPPPAAPAGAARRRLALVAEDSITARVFLTRMLFQQGIEVEAVSTATELLERLVTARWDLVFVDVELPDGHGAAWLARAREAAALAAPGARVIALLRDRADLQAAREAGVSLTLAKPVRPEDLARLLAAVPERPA